MIQCGKIHHPLKNYYWTPKQFASFTTIALTTAETPMSSERLVCKVHSATLVFCFPWDGEVYQSAFEILLKIHSRGKEKFDCTSQNGFVIHSCELQISFRRLSPTGSSKTSLALRPGSVHQRCLSNNRKKITVQRLCFICFDEGIENLSWAACSFTSISHQPQGKILRVKFSKINFCDISHQENPCRIFQLFQHHPIIQTESSWMLIKPVSPSEFIQDTSVPEERVWQQMTERKILKWHPLQNLLNSGWLSSHSSFPFISSLPTVSLSG